MCKYASAYESTSPASLAVLTNLSNQLSSTWPSGRDGFLTLSLNSSSNFFCRIPCQRTVRNFGSSVAHLVKTSLFVKSRSSPLASIVRIFFALHKWDKPLTLTACGTGNLWWNSTCSRDLHSVATTKISSSVQFDGNLTDLRRGLWRAILWSKSSGQYTPSCKWRSWPDRLRGAGDRRNTEVSKSWFATRFSWSCRWFPNVTRPRLKPICSIRRSGSCSSTTVGSSSSSPALGFPKIMRIDLSVDGRVALPPGQNSAGHGDIIESCLSGRLRIPSQNLSCSIADHGIRVVPAY